MAPEEARDGGGRHPARHFSALMPAHAVGNDEHLEFGKEDEAILVVIALSPYVGDACSDCTHVLLHLTTGRAQVTRFMATMVSLSRSS